MCAVEVFCESAIPSCLKALTACPRKRGSMNDTEKRVLEIAKENPGISSDAIVARLGKSKHFKKYVSLLLRQNGFICKTYIKERGWYYVGEEKDLH